MSIHRHDRLIDKQLAKGGVATPSMVLGRHFLCTAEAGSSHEERIIWSIGFTRLQS